jgi:propane monooxygenase small subunit
MAPLWGLPDVKPRDFDHALARAERRLAGIVSDLGLQMPAEAQP